MSMFKGEGSEIVNAVANAILLVRDREMEQNGPDYTPRLLAYVGQKQLYAIMRINTPDRHAVRDCTFLDAKIIEVRKDDYLDVVLSDLQRFVEDPR